MVRVWGLGLVGNTGVHIYIYACIHMYFYIYIYVCSWGVRLGIKKCLYI